MDDNDKLMIGLEIHSYLNTKSKLFCSCSTDSENKGPNSICCPFCLGHPGAKPVLNEKATELAIKIGLALNCNINSEFFFSRKTYFYPDLANNYQITQYEIPVAEKGFVILSNGKKVRIRRVHLEIDPAALTHPEGMSKSTCSLIDYNRSGLALVEIVTEPDISSPKEAREFLNTLEGILYYLETMKPGNTLKVDCNISIQGGNRTEIKNVSGYAAAEKALNYELLRQKQELKLGKKIEQHTRAFDAEAGITLALRKKESEDDYGYIFEPDLVSVVLAAEELQRIKEDMPELPCDKAKRFQKEYSIAEYDANVICSDKLLADLFEKLVEKEANSKATAQLLTRELLSILNHDSLSLKEIEVSVNALYDLIELIAQKKVSDKNVKQSMINYISGDKSVPAEYLEKNGLLISEQINIDAVLEKILLDNRPAVEDYKTGNTKVLNYLAGLVMRETKGAVSPHEVQEKLKEKLDN